MPKVSVSKEVNKLTKVIHPKSRKTAAISKQLRKVTSREKTKLLHHMRNNLLGEKVLWFRDNADPAVTEYAPQNAIALIDKFINRFDEELEQIQLKHSIGNRNKNRQHASREDILKLTKLREEEEFNTSGLEVPDIMNQKQLGILRAWNGELRFLQNFTLVRYNRNQLSDINTVAENMENIDDVPAATNS